MPRLWSATIDDHRRAVHAAILDGAASLIAEHGVAGVSMSQIAQHTGIGRATLYKYFSDVEAIVLAWHERQVAEHLALLAEAAEVQAPPLERLRHVLITLAGLSGGRHTGVSAARHTPDLSVSVHRAEHLQHARRQLRDVLTGIIRAAVEAGDVRGDVPATELATFCLHALGASADLPNTHASRRRLVTLTLAALLAEPGGA